MIKAAIFDVDGVIVNTDHLVSKAYEIMLTLHNKVPIFNEHGLVHKSGTREVDVFKHMQEHYGIEEDLDTLTKQKAEIYDDMLKDLKPESGAVELLKLFKQHHILLAIATSGIGKRVRMKLQTVGVLHYFPIIVSGDEVNAGKPAPDIYLEAARRLNVDSKDCVVFEDAELGVASAHAAGMRVIAIPTEYTKKHDFSQANIVVNSLDEVTWKMLTNL